MDGKKSKEAVRGDLSEQAAGARLTFRQRRFANEFARSGNALQSARNAGFSARDSGAGSRLLAMPRVQAYVEELLADFWKKEEMTTAEILARLARVARVDPKRFFREDGTCRPVAELDEATAACIRSWDEEQVFERDGAPPTTVRKIRFADPVPALRTLAQIEQLLQPETRTTNIFVDLDLRLDRARKRFLERKAREAELDGQSGMSLTRTTPPK